MIYLLDVNALVALGFQQHEFHNRMASWVRKHRPSHLATCPITELGFVRVLSQAAAYGLAITQAQALLLRLEESIAPQFVFIPDDRDVSHLPAWVKTAAQVSDGHLAELAKAHSAVLATLDRKIPGAFLIPEK
ncbi:MAG: PIN domain-containing protein [Actinomycetota bacterium]